MLGFLLSILPVPPLALTGVAIDVINLKLLSTGRLPPHERNLVRVSLGLGIACSILSIGLSVSLIMLIGHFRHESSDLVTYLFQQLAILPGHFRMHGYGLTSRGQEFRQL